MPVMTVLQAINHALSDEMACDDSVLVFGEDVGKLGGVFRATEGLSERFGNLRCFDTPLAESGIIGAAVGFALYGYRPVPEIQFDGFAHPAFDQLVTHLSRYHNRTRGRVEFPVTVRVPYGGGIGAIELHGESPESYWIHTPGLRVVTPSAPADAYWMLRQAIQSQDPVIFLEPKRRYYNREHVDLDSDPALPLERAIVRREGTAVTLVAYGPMVLTALQAADVAAESGVSCEVLDLRSLSPLDDETVFASVRKTGRCIVTHEAPRTLGVGAEISARISEELFYDLEAPVLRATGFDTPYPPAQLENFWLPGVARILGLISKSLSS